MATKLEKLLVSINSKKANQEIKERMMTAISRFMDPVEISSWESFKYYMLIFVEYLDENIQLFEQL